MMTGESMVVAFPVPDTQTAPETCSHCYLKLSWNIVLVQRKYSSKLEALGNYVDWFMHLLGTDGHRTRSNLAPPRQTTHLSYADQQSAHLSTKL